MKSNFFIGTCWEDLKCYSFAIHFWPMLHCITVLLQSTATTNKSRSFKFKFLVKEHNVTVKTAKIVRSTSSMLLFISRPYLSNGRAVGMVVASLSVCLSVGILRLTAHKIAFYTNN